MTTKLTTLTKGFLGGLCGLGGYVTASRVGRIAAAAAASGVILTSAGSPRLAAQPLQAPRAAARTDAQIKIEVERRLVDLKLNLSRVKVAVRDAVVTLTGAVDNVWQKRQAIDRARKVGGVESVVSDLSVRKLENDTALAVQVGQQIVGSMFYTLYDEVEGSVLDGAVVLTGRVTSPDKVSRLEDEIARIRGVRAIDNRLKVLPPSQSDAEIRAWIATLIYGDLMFQDAATQKYPPIHVIVENGHITLNGFVKSNVERVKAESLAREAPGVFSVTNRLRLNNQER